MEISKKNSNFAASSVAKNMEQVVDITNLSAYKENNRIEAKKAKDSLPNSLWETYSSFANTDGGIILLGVVERPDHSFQAIGVTDSHKLLTDFWNAIHNRQKVSLNILTDRMVEEKQIDGKDIILIRVPRAERRQRPIYVGADPKKGTYRRDGEGDYLCTADQIAAMYRDASDVSVDLQVMQTLDMSVLDMDTIRRYRNRFMQFHPSHVWLDDDNEMFLRHIGALAPAEDGMFRPTAAGLLMFGHEYDIVREFPNYFLDYQERFSDETRWTHRLVSTSGDWSGNLYDFFFRIYPRLTSDLPVPFIAKGKDRQDETELHLAVREILANALVHADYYDRQGVVIVKSAEGFKFANPGDMRIGLQAAMAGGVSDPRNVTLLKMFALVDIGERAGSGIPGFVHTWRYWVKKEPQFTLLSNPSRTMLFVPATAEDLRKVGEKMAKTGGLKVDSEWTKGGLKVDRSGLSGTARAICELYDANPDLTYDEIARQLGKARSGIAKHIKRLREGGFL